MNKNISIKPFKNNVGAFIDLDLNTANKDQINKIKNALDDYGVIFFRNQNLNSENYISFFSKFFRSLTV